MANTDDELDLSEESEEDFSASEDDWVPDKNHKKSSEDEEEEDESDTDDQTNRNKKYSSKNRNTRNANILPVKNKLSKTERERLYLQSKSKIQSSKNGDSTDDDSSSGDDCLVDPASINLKSKFFNTISKLPQETAPNFDCNIGLKLSDSEEDDEAAIPCTSSSAGKKSLHTADFSNHQKFNQNLEMAKEHLKNFNSNAFVGNNNAEIDVTKLLAQGEIDKESTAKKCSVIKSKKHIAESDDSDWEEVTEKTGINDVQFTVGSGQSGPKKICRETDAEAKLRRHINQKKRELQLLMHKVHVLCWISHGNIVNAALNNFGLTKKCLSTFIPSDQCYPKEKTDIIYFEQISKWYKSQMALKDQAIYPTLKKLPPIATSLALQIDSRQAICKRDFVLIFIILLRSIGIQCRLIINLPVVPIKPLQKDLCMALNENKKKTTKHSDTEIKTKAETKDKVNNHNNIEKSKLSSTSLKDKIKVHMDNITTKSSRKVESKSDNKLKIIENAQNSNNILKRKSTNKEETTPPKISKLNNAQKSIEKNKIESPQFAKSQTKNTAGPSTSQVNSQKNDNKFAMPNVNNSPISRRTRNSKVKKIIAKPPQLDGATSESKSKRTSKKPNLNRLKKNSSNQSDDNDEDNCQPSTSKKSKVESKIPAISKLKRIDRRVLSTDNEDMDSDSNTKKLPSMDFWVEVYCEVDEKWIAINLFKLKFNCIEEIRKTATKPICYVLAWNNNNTIKDVSARYCPQWNTTTRKMRVDQIWFEKSLNSFIDRTKSSINAREDRELNRLHLDEPIPKSISELKSHPLYALERHLLKFEAIYPPNALTVGFIKSEPIYLRDCVHTLRSREIWVKQARVVKPGQEPYKIVKARPKWDRTLNRMLEPQPLEIFGYWQTQPYEPPTAENGIVPRNAYGNVELFKPEMLPKKTVHLQLPGLNRTCKRMGIDCAQAVVGFDFHSGSSHPTFDGFVVCEEFAEKVVEQWFEDQKEADRKEEEKYNQRVYGNWKRLIKGLLIRERLQRKYNFKGDPAESSKKKMSKKN